MRTKTEPSARAVSQQETTSAADPPEPESNQPLSSAWIVLPTKPEDEQMMCCRFGDCEIKCYAPVPFRDHFMQNHMPAAGNHDDSGKCEVNGCYFEYTDIGSYARHLTFHVYHAILQFHGGQVLLKSQCMCYNVMEDGNNVFYNGDPLQCSWNNCGTIFDDVIDFFDHVSCHGKTLENLDRNEIEQKFLCQWTGCGYSTKRKYEMTGHLRHHSGEKAAACPVCGAFFANNTKLIDHCTRQTATESSRLKCMLCNKTFPSERLLRDHGRRHINNHKCPFCEMSLPTPSNLRWHVMHRHSDAAPHICSVCSKGFKSPLDLERHLAKHKESRDYECRVCSRKFKWIPSLQAHERQHYHVEAEPYVCHLCPKKYRKGSSLSLHFLREHNVSLPPGHSRFTYKKCADGYFRVMTERYESVQMEEDEVSVVE